MLVLKIAILICLMLLFAGFLAWYFSFKKFLKKNAERRLEDVPEIKNIGHYLLS